MRLGIVCAAVLLVFYFVFVLTDAGQEAAAIASRGDLAPGPLKAATKGLARYGLPVISGAAVIVFGLIGYRRHGWWLGITVVAVFCGSVGTAEAIKALVPEPEIVTPIRFPSAHSTAAMATACLLVEAACSPRSSCTSNR